MKHQRVSAMTRSEDTYKMLPAQISFSTHNLSSRQQPIPHDGDLIEFARNLIISCLAVNGTPNIGGLLATISGIVIEHNSKKESSFYKAQVSEGKNHTLPPHFHVNDHLFLTCAKFHSSPGGAVVVGKESQLMRFSWIEILIKTIVSSLRVVCLTGDKENTEERFRMRLIDGDQGEMDLGNMEREGLPRLSDFQYGFAGSQAASIIACELFYQLCAYTTTYVSSLVLSIPHNDLSSKIPHTVARDFVRGLCHASLERSFTDYDDVKALTGFTRQSRLTKACLKECGYDPSIFVASSGHRALEALRFCCKSLYDAVDPHYAAGCLASRLDGTTRFYRINSVHLQHPFVMSKTNIGIERRRLMQVVGQLDTAMVERMSELDGYNAEPSKDDCGGDNGGDDCGTDNVPVRSHYQLQKSAFKSISSILTTNLMQPSSLTNALCTVQTYVNKPPEVLSSVPTPSPAITQLDAACESLLLSLRNQTGTLFIVTEEQLQKFNEWDLKIIHHFDGRDRPEGWMEPSDRRYIVGKLDHVRERVGIRAGMQFKCMDFTTFGVGWDDIRSAFSGSRPESMSFHPSLPVQHKSISLNYCRTTSVRSLLEELHPDVVNEIVWGDTQQYPRHASFASSASDPNQNDLFVLSFLAILSFDVPVIRLFQQSNRAMFFEHFGLPKRVKSCIPEDSDGTIDESNYLYFDYQLQSPNIEDYRELSELEQKWFVETHFRVVDTPFETITLFALKLCGGRSRLLEFKNHQCSVNPAKFGRRFADKAMDSLQRAALDLGLLFSPDGLATDLTKTGKSEMANIYRTWKGEVETRSTALHRQFDLTYSSQIFIPAGGHPHITFMDARRVEKETLKPFPLSALSPAAMRELSKVVDVYAEPFGCTFQPDSFIGLYCQVISRRSIFLYSRYEIKYNTGTLVSLEERADFTRVSNSIHWTNILRGYGLSDDQLGSNIRFTLGAAVARAKLSAAVRAGVWSHTPLKSHMKSSLSASGLDAVHVFSRHGPTWQQKIGFNTAPVDQSFHIMVQISSSTSVKKALRLNEVCTECQNDKRLEDHERALCLVEFRSALPHLITVHEEEHVIELLNTWSEVIRGEEATRMSKAKREIRELPTTVTDVTMSSAEKKARRDELQQMKKDKELELIMIEERFKEGGVYKTIAAEMRSEIVAAREASK